MSVLVVPIGAGVGSVAAAPIPWLVLAAVAVAALLDRRLLLLTLAVGCWTSALAHRSLDGLDAPIEVGRVEATATLVRDPRTFGSATVVDVSLDGRRYEVSAFGGARFVLAEARLGDRIVIIGERSPPRPGDRSWFRPRHVAGRIVADRVSRPLGAATPFALANEVHDRLREGAASLADDERALFLGLVVGDDREQSHEVRERWRAAGLSHLLAVSGQNVAFVLLLAGPLLRRLPPAPRLLAVGALLAFFVILTRIEPSVSRAAVMAGLVAAVDVAGRPTSTIRVLSTAVVVLLLVDPLLVWSVGFRLSVAATLGIAVLHPWFRRRVPGPRWWRDAVSVTVAAQLGVAPLLLATFGPVPLASLPANLLAGPVAGAVMVWGATAGLLAGFAPDGVAAVLHVPTGLGVRWIDGVARVTTELDLPELGAGALIAVVGAAIVVGAAVGRRGLERRARRRPLTPPLASRSVSDGRDQVSGG
ncbi:MAG: ComEC/Rec2 family competence protein [Actinomycetota bacterium]